MELEYPRRTYAVIFRVGTPISPGYYIIHHAGYTVANLPSRPAGCCSGISVPCRFLNNIYTYQSDRPRAVSYAYYTRTRNLLFDCCHVTAGSFCSTGSKLLLLATFIGTLFNFSPFDTQTSHTVRRCSSFWPYQKLTETGFSENHRFEYYFQVLFFGNVLCRVGNSSSPVLKSNIEILYYLNNCIIILYYKCGVVRGSMRVPFTAQLKPVGWTWCNMVGRGPYTFYLIIIIIIFTSQVTAAVCV